MKKAFSVTFMMICSYAFALQGGPSQPDYAQFEPSDLPDMVNLQTGNFTYSIPLGEVPGAFGNFPLSLSYHAGISPQQEASWVGLGWTLNPGAINRDLRGVPDDQFHGGTLGFIYQYSAWHYWNIDFSYGYGAYSVGMNASSNGGVGMSYSVGIDLGEIASVGFSVSNESFGLNASVGYNGVGLNQSLAVSMKDGSLSGSTGLSASAKTGSNSNVSASIGASYGQGHKTAYKTGFSLSNYEDAGNGRINKTSLNISSNGVGVSGTQSVKNEHGKYVPSGVGVSINVANSVSKGGGKTSSSGFALVVPTPIGIFNLGFNDNIYEYSMRSATSDYVYGYMYQGGPAIIADSDNNVTGMPVANIESSVDAGTDMKWTWNLKGRTLEKLGDQRKFPAYDMFNVASEGTSGSFRLFPRQTHQIYELVSDSLTDNHNVVENYSTMTINENVPRGMPLTEEFKKGNDGKNIDSEYKSYKQCLDDDSCSPYALYATNIRNEGNRIVYRKYKDGKDTVSSGMNFLFVGEGGYYETEDLNGKAQKRSHHEVYENLLKRSVDNHQYALYGSKKIEPIFEDDSPVGSLKGFVITASNGNKYVFGKPVKSYLKIDYSINKEKGAPMFVDKPATISTSEFWKDFAKGYATLVAGIYYYAFTAGYQIYKFFAQEGKLNETCSTKEDKDKVADVFFSYQVNMNPYATQWLLTEIQGADYIRLGDSASVGYNVKLNYTDPSVYYWRTPYARPNLAASDLPNFRLPTNGMTPEGCDSRKYQASFGIKEYVYLESIETSTHKVKFILNDPKKNEEQRVDGKGWEKSYETVEGFSDIPILIQANLVGMVKSTGEAQAEYEENCWYCFIDEYLTGEKLEMSPEYLYWNSKLPDIFADMLKKKGKIRVLNFANYGFPEKDVNEDDVTKLRKRFYNFDSAEYLLTFDENATVERVSGEESVYGLYRIKLSSTGNTIKFNSFYPGKKFDGEKLVLGEAGINASNPLIDWSDIVFDESIKNDSTNQMRYLKRIAYYKKDDLKNPYQIFDFNYDYSLQPKTLNSYCTGKYPQNNEDISNSPDSVGLGVCADTSSKNSLYGKLTLKSISEKGCRNGKCSYLPPFKFEYNSPSLTSTRLSTKDGWKELSQQVIDQIGDSLVYQYPEEYYKNLTDVDASVMASSNAVDDWGFWSVHGTSENHKVDQSFADYGAAAWSLNKVTDPAGGIMEVSYERDVYQNGSDYASDKRYVSIIGFGKCDSYNTARKYSTSTFELSKIKNDKYTDNLCVEIGPLYWREQCTGPRDAFWDTKKPMGYSGSGFEYLDTMGINISEAPHVMLNLTAKMGTDVDCGALGLFDCPRTKSVAIVTDAGILDSLYPVSNKNNTRLLVLDEKYENVREGFEQAAYRINRDNDWSVDSDTSRKGFMWTVLSYPEMKGGDLRVKKITRIDIDRTSQSEYDYTPGELALLPDSEYTTILGNRFYGNKIAFGMPNMELMPKSRIVGFDDDDLIYIPGSSVSYPKVTVKNTDPQGKTMNGFTSFKYITPESGIPREFIDKETLSKLKPFMKINVSMFNYGEYNPKAGKRLKSYDYTSFYTIFYLYDSTNALIDSLNVLVAQNKSNSFMIYSDDVRKAKYLKVKIITQKDGTFFEDTLAITKDNEKLTDYNEVALSLNLRIAKSLDLNRMWLRSQKDGYVPILYRNVEYGVEPFEVVGPDVTYSSSYKVHGEANFEKSVLYYDFTSFLGLNYEVEYFRGNDSSAIKTKVIKNMYSTKVPDVAANVVETTGNVEEKVGIQHEKWQTVSQLRCVSSKDNKKNVMPNSGKDSHCLIQYAPLYERKAYDNDEKDVFGKDSVNYGYIRYPAFLISTKTFAGFDNQRTDGVSLSSETTMEYHRFDPVTTEPTASLARAYYSRGKNVLESRKLTVKHPHYYVKRDGKYTELANQMFLKNMLSQNFYDAIYSGVVDSAASWNSIEQKDSLRSFTFAPFRKVPDSLYTQDTRPIVAWGDYSSKDYPKNYFRSAKSLLDVVSEYQDASKGLPDLKKFSGTNIMSIDSNFKITQIEDAQGRVLATHFSSNGVYQTCLFFPAELSETASVVPVGNEVAQKNCSVESIAVDIGKGGIILKSKPVCSVRGGDLVVEYRAKINGSWKVAREEYSEEVLSDLKAGVILNYLRIYPKDSESKTFVTDSYGMMVQAVAEDNTSTYYEYDPTGNLVQIRNDDGVSFKSHHREFRNDTLDNVPVNEFVGK